MVQVAFLVRSVLFASLSAKASLCVMLRHLRFATSVVEILNLMLVSDRAEFFLTTTEQSDTSLPRSPMTRIYTDDCVIDCGVIEVTDE